MSSENKIQEYMNSLESEKLLIETEKIVKEKEKSLDIELSNRKDLTDQLIVTIDGENKFYDNVTRDVLDETLKNIENYNQRLYINEGGIGEEITQRLKALNSANELENETFYNIQPDFNQDEYDNAAFVLDDEEFDKENKIDKKKSMNNKTGLQRFLILFAGAGFNFILAFIVLFVSALFYGSVSTKPVVGSIMNDYPAAEAGLKVGDKILKIDGKTIKTWDDILTLFSDGTPMKFLIEREGETKKQIEEFYKELGDRVPAELHEELAALEARLG